MSPRCPRARSRWRSLDPGPKAGRCAIPEYSAISIRSVFQSSPGPKAGRCPSTLAWRRRHYRRFNPRPARRPGAARVRSRGVGGTIDVSILARPEGRALPAMCKSLAVALYGFQSSPGPKAGRCRAEEALQAAPRVVSILARPEGRALPLQTRRNEGSRPGFSPGSSELSCSGPVRVIQLRGSMPSDRPKLRG